MRLVDGASGSASVQQAVREHVGARVQRWYPELTGPQRVELSTLSQRPSCSLYLVRVRAGEQQRRVLAKVRRDLPGGSNGAAGDRPRLRTDPASAEELTVSEHRGLQALADLAAEHPGGFGAVRPLDVLPEHATLLMEYVDAGTLREALLAQSRLAPPFLPWPRSARPPYSAWPNAGRWLRTFHDQVPGPDARTRQPTRDSVVERFDAYDRYLTDQLGRRVLGRVASTGAGLAGTLLPERLPLATGHGDFAPRNVFVDDQGRLSVIDPMPRWRVPRYEDLSRFLVALRLLGLQVHTRGLAYSAAELDRREEAVVAGYFGTDAIPRAELGCYQLLIVLDKWSALVAAATGGSGPVSAARAAAQRIADGYIRAEADRLLAPFR